MRRVYFDGTYPAAAEVMRACDASRVWVVKSRDLHPTEETFLTEVCPMDACGTRGHFEGRKYVKHESFGSARLCDPSTATMESLVSRIAHDETIADEDKVDILGRVLRPCPRPVCGYCALCVRASEIASDYGIYDLDLALKARTR